MRLELCAMMPLFISVQIINAADIHSVIANNMKDIMHIKNSRLDY